MEQSIQKIQPDIEFIRTLKQESSASIKKCMQCGQCSVVCRLSETESPFPRKEMIWSGWGMREKLIGNPDIWLCHQCGDCSTYCPRGVKPSDVLATLRQINYRHYARPKFLSKILSKPAYLPVAVLIPLTIILTIIYLAGTLSIPEGPVNYSRFFPHAWLNASFTIITLTVIGMTLTGIRRFWADLRLFYPDKKGNSNSGIAYLELLSTIFLHSKFRKCTSNNSRKIAHFLVFYGFILLLIVTLYAILSTFIGTYPLTPLNLFKILGNIAALMLTTGCVIMIIQRLNKAEGVAKSNYSDWLFIWSLLVLTLSGVMVELGRYLNWNYAYHIYVFHLVCVWFIVIYFPYTKFGHFLYRTIALYYINSRKTRENHY